MTISRIAGTLPDSDIKTFCNQGILISENYQESNVHQACYELTVGNIYYDASQSYARIDLHEDGYEYVLIKPKQSVIIITKEKLNLPNNVMARVLTKGKLFTIGLLPVNTYADPGFDGNLGIVLHNSSTYYIKLKEGEPIAKVEFSVLSKAVDTPYNGQHGYQSKIWPIPVEFYLTDKEVNADSRIGNPEKEMGEIFGSRYTKVIHRLLNVEKKLIIAACFYFTFSILIIGFLVRNNEGTGISNLVTVLLGLISNVAAFFFIYLIEKSKFFNGK